MSVMFLKGSLCVIISRMWGPWSTCTILVSGSKLLWCNVLFAHSADSLPASHHWYGAVNLVLSHTLEASSLFSHSLSRFVFPCSLFQIEQVGISGFCWLFVCVRCLVWISVGHQLVQRFAWISSVPPDKFQDSTCDLPTLSVTSLPVFYWPFIWSLVAYSLSCWRCCQTPWSKRYQVHSKWCLSTKMHCFTSQKTVTFNTHCQNFKSLYTFLFP